MSAARNILFALGAAVGLAAFALGWIFWSPGHWWWVDVGADGLILFAAFCGLAWRCRS